MNVGQAQSIKSFQIIMNAALLFLGVAVIVPIFWGSYYQKERQSQAHAEVLAYQIMQLHQKQAVEGSSISNLEMAFTSSSEKESLGKSKDNRGPASVEDPSGGKKAASSFKEIGTDPWGNPYRYKVEWISGKQKIKIWSTRTQGADSQAQDQVVQSFVAGPSTFVQIFE